MLNIYAKVCFCIEISYITTDYFVRCGKSNSREG